MIKGGANVYLLGYDIGSSSIKACLLDTERGTPVGTASSPDTELGMITKKPGWAEQEPSMWWEHLVNATNLLKKSTGKDFKEVEAIGISYQMHGLVAVDKNKNVLRPSIIWCDSRAVESGNAALEKIGAEKALEHLLNFPGNFTASKLGWVKRNEPDLYSRIHRIMLPGDFIAMKLTGEITTTASGLSEMILWDYIAGDVARIVLEAFGISEELLPARVPTFGVQGLVRKEAASVLGLREGIKVAYRAGDQPNNALSLNVLEPGEIATTAGTSGVVYAVGDTPSFDPESRVNTFVHVSNTKEKPRYGTLMCVNGCGIAFSWLRRAMFEGASYNEIDKKAATISPGADGLMVFPYGNGAERTLGNENPLSSFRSIGFNVHTKDHFARACQEGIVYAFKLGFDIMKQMGLRAERVRVGHANLFLSPLFREVFVNTLSAPLEVYETDGSQGAARGAGMGAGVFKSSAEAFSGLKKITQIDPDKDSASCYAELYAKWKKELDKQMGTS